ncbi:hypothetical protein PHLGIDRAFT_19322 [Phlebiopsis gigantea 11061_1 CR5-6]|uniref:Uncharacterized protein n=1 Tax=Phlebiopsis gigantea (strain 11061_1 CR5-6) TaxID=745531 RepID=A0A0C3SAD2_PHLG1|nr:hypothetical protein PHLGIDRAFT_19322 [Phlebiopsis gigantea 11061_1 CR5-6]
MRPTLLLTRVFAIYAVLVGAAQVAYGAPIASPDQPIVAVAVGVEGANVAREVPSIVVRELEIADKRDVETRSDEAGGVDILKRMCLMVWACK